MDFKGEPINWLMVAIPFGRFISVLLHFYYLYTTTMGLMIKKSEQGGDFALFRKLGELIDEQLVTSDTRGHCSIDSPHTAAVSGTFEGEESLEETSSQVDKTRHRQEGRLIQQSLRCLVDSLFFFFFSL